MCGFLLGVWWLVVLLKQWLKKNYHLNFSVHFRPREWTQSYTNNYFGSKCSGVTSGLQANKGLPVSTSLCVAEEQLNGSNKRRVVISRLQPPFQSPNPTQPPHLCLSPVGALLHTFLLKVSAPPSRKKKQVFAPTGMALAAWPNG